MINNPQLYDNCRSIDRIVTTTARFLPNLSEDWVDLDVLSCSINSPMSNDDLTLGGAFSAKVEMSFREVPNVDFSKGKYEITKTVNGTGTPSSVTYEGYYPNECKTKGKVTKVVLYDKLSESAVPYVPNVILPCTDNDVINDICTQLNIPKQGNLGVGATINAIYEADCRTQLGYMAGLCGKNAIMKNGYLTFVEYTNIGKTWGELLLMTWGQVKEMTWGETSGIKFPKSFQRQNGLSAETYFTVEAITSGTEDNPITVGTGTAWSFENPYITQEQVQAIYDKYHGLTYLIGEIDTYGDLTVELGDICLVELGDGTWGKALVSSLTTNFNGLSVKIGSSGVADTTVQFDNSTTLARVVNKMKSAFASVQRTVNDLINSSKGYYTITEETGIPTGWTIKDSITHPIEMLKASLGGIGFSSDGGQTYQNAITGQGIWATAITVGKIVASQLDIIGTAAFYATEDKDSYGVLIMPDVANIFDRDLGYAFVEGGKDYSVGGAYTDALFGFTADITQTFSVKQQIQDNDGVFGTDSNGYLFLVGADGSSEVTAINGDAMRGGYRPYNPQTHDYDDFVTRWSIGTNGDIWLRGGLRVFEGADYGGIWLDDELGNVTHLTASTRQGNNIEYINGWEVVRYDDGSYEAWCSKSYGKISSEWSAWGSLFKVQVVGTLNLPFSSSVQPYVEVTTVPTGTDVLSTCFTARSWSSGTLPPTFITSPVRPSGAATGNVYYHVFGWLY